MAWVEAGVKPAGDEVLDPAAVADPDCGCQFTSTLPGEPRAWDNIPQLASPKPADCPAAP